MRLEIGAKRFTGEWKAGLIVDGKFQDAAIARTLTEVVALFLAPTLSAEYPDGQEIVISVNVVA